MKNDGTTELPGWSQVLTGDESSCATQRVHQLEALYELVDSLHHSGSTHDIFTAALTAIRRALDCDRASVLLADAAGLMRFIAWDGLPDYYREVAEGHSPWSIDDIDPTPVTIVDTHAASFDERLAVVLRQEGIRALAFFPLMSRGRLIGKFMAYFNRPHAFPDGEVQVGVIIARQLTFAIERQALEEARRQSEIRYRAVVEGQAELLCRFRRDGTILFVNGAYARARDASPESLIGTSFWASIPPEEHAAILARLDTLAPDTPEIRIENRFETAAGPRWTLWTNRALNFDPDGRWQEAQSTGIDITDRKRAEEALSLNEERQRLIVSVIADVPWVVDSFGRMVAPQPAWARYTGQAWEDYRDFGWMQALHPDDRDRMWNEWEQSRICPAGFEARGRVWSAGHHEWRHFIAKAAPRLHPEGGIIEWVGAYTDCENEVRSSAQLQKARDEAMAANRAKDDFLAALSHELRAPLNPVLLVASENAEDASLPPHVREDFKGIVDNVSLEVRLIDDLLDFNRIKRGKVILEKSPLDLHQILRDSSASVAGELGDKGITLSFALSPAPCIVDADPVRLRQVFWNVFKNAVKFTPARGSIKVTVACREESREVEVRIRDTGLGMTADELDRVFRPFVQGTHASLPGGRTFGGLGLGLAISRELIEAHGGHIAAESEGRNRGTIVMIRLPVSVASLEVDPAGIDTPGERACSPAQSPEIAPAAMGTGPVRPRQRSTNS